MKLITFSFSGVHVLTETRPIFACALCGEQRVYGLALSVSIDDIPANLEPRLLCGAGCSCGHVRHSYLGKASTTAMVLERGSDGAVVKFGFLFEALTPRKEKNDGDEQSSQMAAGTN